MNLGYIIKLSDLNMKKILLVGSSGFLGKNVFNQINKENLDTYHRWIEVHILSSLLNLPTINVPIGFNKDGLPLGMQIIGKKYEDLKILTFAKRYEQIFVHSKSKPKLN